MPTHSSTLAWKIPWTEEPGGLQYVGSLRVGTTERLHFHFSLSCMGVCARESQGRLSPWQRWLPPAPILGSRGGGGGGGHGGLEDTVGLDGGDDDLLQLLQCVSQISTFQHILSREDTAWVTCQSLQLCRMTTHIGSNSPCKELAGPWVPPHRKGR